MVAFYESVVSPTVVVVCLVFGAPGMFIHILPCVCCGAHTSESVRVYYSE